MFTKPYDEMTREEKLNHFEKLINAQKTGNVDLADKLAKFVPLHPVVANAIKETFGADFIVQNGFNLSEVEAEYGKQWIAQ